MVSLADLREVKQPTTVDKRVCVACEAFQAECHAPVGEGSAPMCWLCAHHVVDHGVAPHEAATAECECAPEQVYPARVLQQRAAWRPPAEVIAAVPNRAGMDEVLRRHAKHAPFIADSSQSGVDAFPKARSSRREALAKKRG